VCTQAACVLFFRSAAAAAAAVGAAPIVIAGGAGGAQLPFATGTSSTVTPLRRRRRGMAWFVGLAAAVLKKFPESGNFSGAMCHASSSGGLRVGS
jgi:hypothetical protein